MTIDPALDRFAEQRRSWRRAGGFFLVLEGIDGTGKSTLARALAEALQAQDRQVVVSAEPTRGPYGRRIRELAVLGRDAVSAEEELQLFMHDRRTHLSELILPALGAGKIVVLDRYYFSSMAYQGSRGADVGEIERRHLEFAPRPDGLVMLDLPVEEALARITRGRGEAPNHFERADALAQVAEIYGRIKLPDPLRLDARQPTPVLTDTILRHYALC